MHLINAGITDVHDAYQRIANGEVFYHNNTKITYKVGADGVPVTWMETTNQSLDMSDIWEECTNWKIESPHSDLLDEGWLVEELKDGEWKEVDLLGEGTYRRRMKKLFWRFYVR